MRDVLIRLLRNLLDLLQGHRYTWTCPHKGCTLSAASNYPYVIELFKEIHAISHKPPKATATRDADGDTINIYRYYGGS
jgi:hypothetical protein